MKSLASLAVFFFLLVSASQAVTWITVTTSVTVLQGGPTVAKTILTSRKYIQEGARRQGDPVLRNYFIGFRADSGLIAVVHIPTKTVVYNVVSGLAQSGIATNGTGTVATITGNATVSSLNVDFTNSYYQDKAARRADGVLRSVARTVLGGAGASTISGTFRTGAKRFEL